MEQMKEYRSKLCPNCINEKCSNNIIIERRGNMTIIKCKDYISNKIDTTIYLEKYINEMKLRKTRNDY